MKLPVRITISLLALAAANVAVADAPKVYTEQCSTCHGPDGKGQSTMGKKLKVKDWSDGKTLNAMNDTDVQKMIHGGKNMMPGFASLSDEQIKAMVEYIRAFQR